MISHRTDIIIINNKSYKRAFMYDNIAIDKYDLYLIDIINHMAVNDHILEKIYKK